MLIYLVTNVKIFLLSLCQKQHTQKQDFLLKNSTFICFALYVFKALYKFCQCSCLSFPPQYPIWNTTWALKRLLQIIASYHKYSVNVSNDLSRVSFAVLHSHKVSRNVQTLCKCWKLRMSKWVHLTGASNRSSPSGWVLTVVSAILWSRCLVVCSAAPQSAVKKIEVTQKNISKTVVLLSTSATTQNQSRSRLLLPSVFSMKKNRVSIITLHFLAFMLASGQDFQFN